MQSTAGHVASALNALVPQAGFHKPDTRQVNEADVHARLATAAALDRIGAALETIARNTTPEPTA